MNTLKTRSRKYKSPKLSVVFNNKAEISNEIEIKLDSKEANKAVATTHIHST